MTSHKTALADGGKNLRRYEKIQRLYIRYFDTAPCPHDCILKIPCVIKVKTFSVDVPHKKTPEIYNNVHAK